LSTPDFYFTRHTSPETSHINDGNSLFVNPPLEQPFDTFDPRRIGTDWASVDTIETTHFNYDTLLKNYYSPHGENYNVSIDVIDGEKLYKVSWHVSNAEFFGSYWIDPQKGYSLVRAESGSEMLDLHGSYNVTLNKFASSRGNIWFPQEVFYRHWHGNVISEERIIVDSIELDVQDKISLTLAGLNIPVGYRVDYFGEGARYWDGRELVEKIPFAVEPIKMRDRKVFWIVNGIIFAILAILILYRYIQLLQRRSH